MLHTTFKYSELSEPLRLDAEYYVVAKSIIKKFKGVFNKIYKGHKTSIVKKHFEIIKEDVPEILPAFVIEASARGKITYKIISKNEKKKRYDFTITSKSNDISVFDLLHFINHSQVKDYLRLQLRGSVISRLSIDSIENLKIPIPKIQLAAKDLKSTSGNFEPVVNEFKTFIALYYQEYSNALREEQLVAATMLAGAISEAILYQVIIDSGVEASLLQNRGLGGLIRDVKLGRFNKIDGQEFDLTPFTTLNNIRNDIVHPSRAINKLKTDYELINKQTIVQNFDRIKRNFGI